MMDRSRRLIANAARASLGFDGRLTREAIADACQQAGVNTFAYRTLFPDDDALLDEVNELLVEECASRLRAGVDKFAAVPDDEQALREAADCLAGSWPLDRAGLLIRSERRMAALRSASPAGQAVAAEKRFVTVLTDVLTEMLHKLGRRFLWRPDLAVRVILDTYERSFEAWLIQGNEESRFNESTFVRVTLPTILRETSTPDP